MEKIHIGLYLQYLNFNEKFGKMVGLNREIRNTILGSKFEMSFIKKTEIILNLEDCSINSNYFHHCFKNCANLSEISLVLS